MVQQSTNNIFENVYKFNGKELDEQTGYYYYGARYYDPATSIFLSVDPLAEQFPNFTPYHYVHNNPINLIDPTGMSAETYDQDPPKIETPQESTMMDEIIIMANKVSSDWEKNKEKSGYNHAANWVNDKGLFSTVSDVNNYVSVGAAVAGTSSKSIKVSTKQFDIGKLGKGLGQVSFLGGIAIDSYGVTTGKTSIGKAGTNLGVGLYGIYVNPFVGVLYGGLEAFYPGGTEGAMSDYGDTQAIYREQNNGAVFKSGL